MEKGKKGIDVRVRYNVVERRKIIYFLRFGGNCHSFFISILSLSVHTFVVTHTIQSSVFIRRGLSPFSSLLLRSEEKTSPGCRAEIWERLFDSEMIKAETNKMWIKEKNNWQDLLPRGEVDPIPDWVTELVVKPLEDCGLIQKVKAVFFLWL